jgi:YHS domain-containing protein
MTAQRQEASPSRPGIALIGLLAGIWLTCSPDLGGLGCPAEAATTERIVVNRFSGVAIEGFDPVAYFVDGKPVQGTAEYEASQAGAVWRFHNEGNRASFLSHPEVYGPQFGGYDPTNVARGVTIAGNPRFFVISAQRLYLFSLEANRDAFAADSERFLREARKRWPALQDGLAQ